MNSSQVKSQKMNSFILLIILTVASWFVGICQNFLHSTTLQSNGKLKIGQKLRKCKKRTTSENIHETTIQNKIYTKVGAFIVKMFAKQML